MNQYEQSISAFLLEYKEVALEKIGVLKLTGVHQNPETNAHNVEFKFDRKATTTSELIDFIAQQSGKNKMLIASDLESHLTQAKEFINIGKTYQIPGIGFIKANNKGEYELLNYSQAVKFQKKFNNPVPKTRNKKRGSSFIQVFTLLIVLAIIAGLGYEGYEYFIKPKTENIVQDSINVSVDTINSTNNITNSSALTKPDSSAKIHSNDDSLLVHYIFETTNLLIRAKSRTAKLISYGSDAGYDSVLTNTGKLYSLYLIQKTKMADTLFIKDSLAKFLQKDIQIKIVSK